MEHHYFDRSGKLSPALDTSPARWAEVIARLRERFPDKEIEPERTGKLSFAVKHDGKWRAWSFGNKALPDWKIDRVEADIRKWVEG